MMVIHISEHILQPYSTPVAHKPITTLRLGRNLNSGPPNNKSTQPNWPLGRVVTKKWRKPATSTDRQTDGFERANKTQNDCKKYLCDTLMLSSFFSLFSGENFTFLFVYFIWKLRNNSQGLGSAEGGKWRDKNRRGRKRNPQGKRVERKSWKGGGWHRSFLSPVPHFCRFTPFFAFSTHYGA